MIGTLLLDRLLKLHATLAKKKKIPYQALTALPAAGSREYYAACEREYESLLDLFERDEDSDKPLNLSDDLESEWEEIMEEMEEMEDRVEEEREEYADTDDADDLEEESFDDGYEFEDTNEEMLDSFEDDVMYEAEGEFQEEEPDDDWDDGADE